MKNRNCPDKDACWDYKASNCEGCAIGEKIARLVRQNKKLKAENANLRHRAEVAERALENKCKNVCSACGMHQAANCKGKEFCQQEAFKRSLEQAEKELAEEKNNDSRRAGMV